MHSRVALRMGALLAASASVAAYADGIDYNLGADLRIRHELMDNVPGCPGGGLVNPNARSDFAQHMRFRPRVWGEVSGTTESAATWRIYTRLADEFRWCPEPHKHAQTFPGELIIDNLFVEGTGLFDGLLDLRVGRQDLYNYCGLDHIFYDGTPGDGSRTLYTDMAAFKFHVSEVSTVSADGIWERIK